MDQYIDEEDSSKHGKCTFSASKESFDVLNDNLNCTCLLISCCSLWITKSQHIMKNYMP